MVVDDNSATRRMVTNALVRNGHQVLEAPDGRTARELMVREHPRVVLQDLMLPDADGFELVGELRDLAGPDVSILAFSGFASKLDEARASTAGFDDIIPKPIAPSRLVPLIEAHLARNRRVFRQLDRQVLLDAGLAQRCSALASELIVLAGISEAVFGHRDVEVALDDALATCFDAGGVPVGALYLLDDHGALRTRPVGGDPEWPPPELASFFGREDLLRSVIARGKPMYLPSADARAEIVDELLAMCEASALLVVPLAGRSGPLGALLMVARARELDRDDWRAFGVGVGTQISQVLTLARAYADRESAEHSAVRRAAALDQTLADRMSSVGTLAAGLAHEINNPLAAVIANIDTVLQDIARVPDLPGEVGEALRDALTAADRVRDIVRDLETKIMACLGGSLTVTGSVSRTALAEGSSHVDAAARRGRVLVVDDEEPLAQAIRRYLAQDHDVDTCRNGREALDRLMAGERYDIILSDLMMPEMSGMDLHEALLKLDPAQADRMVFLTGGAFTQRAREFVETVTNQHIEKPFDLKALRSIVNRLIR
jgi:DNA-binding response OmpR family regulator